MLTVLWASLLWFGLSLVVGCLLGRAIRANR
jgi:short subunit fatty acids transporter